MKLYKPASKTRNGGGDKPRGGINPSNRISVRFRNINIFIFLLTFCVIAAVLALVFNSVIFKTSSEYAARYAYSTAEAFGAHVKKDIGLLSKAAHSSAVIEWLADEYDETKKARAYDEMSGIVGELYSFNIYIGLEQSLNEYRVESGGNDTRPFDVLSESEREDEWYFKCVRSDSDYILSVDIDHVLQRKRVWLDYKVIKDGVMLGVICTGLEFSHVAEELFSQYDGGKLRGLIIDENGVIYMDSFLLDERAFLHGKAETRINEEFHDAALLSAVDAFLNGGGNYAEEMGTAESTKLSSGAYRYMTIAPIQDTGWAVIILSGVASMFDISYVLPILIIALVMLFAFALTTSIVNFRLIFLPLGHLERSLSRMKENRDEPIYGLERDDELGRLSNTIQDLFNKANTDALTGIYNRRFMENNLEHIMELLSRTNGLLSVLMMDIDFFKKFNDANGHDQGDVCLKAVAKVLDSAVGRTNDFTARYGGEEFIAVLPGTDENGARVVAEKILENIRAMNMPHPDNAAAPCVTVSVGVTTGQVRHTQSWETYVKHADEALYMSKQSGRNKYTFLSLEDEPV